MDCTDFWNLKVGLSEQKWLISAAINNLSMCSLHIPLFVGCRVPGVTIWGRRKILALIESHHN